MKLYIAEKKDLALAISTALEGSLTPSGIFYEGEGFKVTWLYGHVLRLGNPEEHSDQYAKWSLDSLPMNWPIQHIPESKHQEHLKKIVKAIHQASQIINAGDPDPEGQRLVDEVIEHAGKKPSQALRLLINDNNPSEVLKANAAMQSNEDFQGLSQSALARAVCDQRYGFNLTRLYTLLARQKGYQSILSVGRVQTPILGLVVDRDKAHEAHSKQYYFNVNANINVGGLVTEAVYLPTENDPLDDSGRINSRDFSDSLAQTIKGKSAQVESADTKQKSVSPPPPHNLLTLQAEAAGKFNLKPSKVLEITQSLRDQFKAITYNRSDSRYLNDERHQEAPALLAELQKSLPEAVAGCDTEIKSKAFNSGKVTAHHAIIPTLSVPPLDQLSEDQKNIYLLIANLYLAQFYQPETYRITTVIFNVDDRQLKATGRVDQNLGWRVLFKDELHSDKEKRIDLEAIQQGDQGRITEAFVSEHSTKPPARYTMKTLLLDLTRVAKYVTDPQIKKLLIEKDSDKDNESGGIGTPATRDSHIETLFTRGFIKDDKKSIVSTEVGREFHDLLPDFAIKPDLTALWHNKQQQIEQGEMDYQSLVSEVDKVVADEIERAQRVGLTIKVASIPCTACENGFIVPRTNFEKKKFWACTNYPQCKKTFADDKGKPVLSGQEKGKPCKACEDGSMIRKKGSAGFFWGCSNFPVCKHTMKDKKGKPVKNKKLKLSKFCCPKCNSKLVRRKSKEAKQTYWWGCSGYPGCTHTAFDKDGKPVSKK